MPLPSSSTTNVGSGGRSPGKGMSPRGGGGGGGATTRQRRATPNTRSKTSSIGTGASTMWRFYNEDSPGLKVGPVPVLVMSLLFIASVFMLHIWGKYTRSA